VGGAEQRGTAASGRQISAPGFLATGWLAVRPDDAGHRGPRSRPFSRTGPVPDVFYSTTMERCFGYEDHVGADTIPEFDVPWWYRSDFSARLAPGQYDDLVVNGVVGQADVWVDGTEVASQATVEGDDTRSTFAVSPLLTGGSNALALEVFPNDPKTMSTLDDVDWSQIPPDNNTGIQFPVPLEITDAVSVGNDYVTEDNAAAMSSSALTVHADVTNRSGSAPDATVAATITPPPGGGPAIEVSRSVPVPAKSTRTVTFSPAAFPALTIEKPLLWWPCQMGGQPLYQLSTSVTDGATTFSSRRRSPPPMGRPCSTAPPRWSACRDGTFPSRS
jgi:exo-1,4-beta-D-glucosaminidase